MSKIKLHELNKDLLVDNDYYQRLVKLLTTPGINEKYESWKKKRQLKKDREDTLTWLKIMRQSAFNRLNK